MAGAAQQLYGPLHGNVEKTFLNYQVAPEACESEPSFEGEFLQAAKARIHLNVAFRKLRKRGFI